MRKAPSNRSAFRAGRGPLSPSRSECTFTPSTTPTWQRWVLPGAGLMSLIWFLVRVIPKPSRAAYPCQRAAAPLASSFVVWMLALSASLFARCRSRQLLRRARLSKAGVYAAVAAVGAAVVLVRVPQPAVEAGATGAHGPLGEGKGVHTGRVVWVHAPEATDWEGFESSEHWYDNKHTDPNVVARMVSRAIRGVAGLDTDVAAWEAIFRHFNAEHGRGDRPYQAGEKIAVKVNLVTCFSGVPPISPPWVDLLTHEKTVQANGVDVAPQMIRALLKQLVEVVGVPQADITVGDPTALWPDSYLALLQPEFPAVHYLYNHGWRGRTRAEFTNVPIAWSTAAASGKEQDYLPTAFADADYFVNFAVLKGHSAGITVCGKNNYGSLIRLPNGFLRDGGAQDYYNLHLSLPNEQWSPGMGHYRAVVDFMGHAQLGGKTLLYLVDGLYGGYYSESQPHKWMSSPFGSGVTGDWPSSLFASQDPVAIDSVAYDFLLAEWPDVVRNGVGGPDSLQGGAEDYLHEAALANVPPSGTFYDPHKEGIPLRSLGVHEHWNNPVAKQYSRNQGLNEGIELVSLDAAPAAPVLAAIENQTIDELETLTLTATATDPDQPPQTLTYSLGLGAPAGAGIDPMTGVFSWTPNESQGPGSYPITATVTDDGTPPLSDTKSFQVTVNEVNAPPVVAAIADATIDPWQTLTVLCTASDPDIPVNALSWQLVQAPHRATINPITGQVTWTPAGADAGQVFEFTVQATDNGVPPLSDQESFSVTVNPIVTDPTGIEWSLVSTPYAGRLSGVEYGAGLFVAVGDGGTILTSPDGETWTTRTTPTTQILWGLKYGCGRFVVAAHNGVILTSIDGINWELSESGVTAHLTDVAFAGETCVVVGNFNTILTSPLGAGPWTLQPVATANHFQDVTYGGGYFVASGTGGLIATSPDGITWAVRDSGTTAGVPMTAYGNGVWIVGGDGGTLLKSSNLIDWEPVSSGVTSGLAGASHGINRFVVVGGEGAPAYTGMMLVSTNGLDWVIEETPSVLRLEDVAYAQSQGVWVAVGRGGSVLRSVRLFEPWALTVEAESGGDVIRNPDRLLFDNDEPVTLTAVADETHVFIGWGGDLAGDTNPTQLVMNTNKVVTASFTPKAGCVLTVNIVGQGTVVLDPAKPQYDPGQVVELTATPADGWLFIDWSGAISGESSPESVTMDADKTVTARFMAPPVLTPVLDQAVSEQVPLALMFTATDADSPLESLRYALIQAPEGATLNAVTGAFAWTPTESQGPGSYEVHVRVNDNGLPPLTGETSFTINVAEVNTPPSLAYVPDRTFREGIRSLFSAAAADGDVPAQNLTFAIESGPQGAAVDPVSGKFQWTPTEEQGPGVYFVTLKVTDDGNPAMSASRTFRATVTEDNQPPVLGTVGDRNLNEGELLTFTATAVDPDLPQQPLTFGLEGAPLGATIDQNTGVFTWTPTEDQGPGDFTVTIKVSDSQSPPLSDSKSVTITVHEVNDAPVLGGVTDRAVNEEQLLTFTVAATDPDLPKQAMTFALEGAPAGAAIDPTTGAFTWTPTEEQGQGVYPMTVKVSDTGDPVLTDSKPFTVTIAEVNKKPKLTPVANQAVDEGTVLLLTPKATDDDLPANSLTYSLGPEAPDGATVNPTTGAFYWRPSESQGPDTHSVTLRVTDNGTPPLDDSVTFDVNVREVNRAPEFASIGRQSVAVGDTLQVTVAASDDDLPANQLVYGFAETPPIGALIDSVTGLFTWTPGWEFASTTNKVSLQVTDDGLPPLCDTVAFDVVVGAGAEIRLTCSISPDGEFRLYVTGEPGQTLFVETSSDLEEWSVLTSVVGTGESVEIIYLEGLAHGRRFYRVVAP